MMAVHQNQIAEAGPGNNLSYIAAVPPACQYLKLSSALAMDTHTHTQKWWMNWYQRGKHIIKNTDYYTGHPTRFEKASSVSRLTANGFGYFTVPCQRVSWCKVYLHSIRPLVLLVYFGRHVPITSKTSF